MWQGNEIKENDSGLVVSNKLDAEFARIQNEELRLGGKVDMLEYSDTNTVLDKSEDRLIVSPYTMWSVLTPMSADLDDINDVGKHFSEVFFDGKYWIRTDVPIEFIGVRASLDSMREGEYITKSNITEVDALYESRYLRQDGTTDLLGGYTPKNNTSMVLGLK